MATAADSVVTLARGAFPALGDKLGLIEARIDLSTVSAELVAQGDGELATGDIVQCLSIPKGMTVLMAGIEVITALAGATATDLDLGVTGGTVDRWVDGADLGAMAAGDFATQDQTAQAALLFPTADTIDILFNSITGSVTAGVLRVFAVVADTNSLTD